MLIDYTVKVIFDSQKRLLRQGVNLAIMFANDSAVGKNGIERKRKSHSKLSLNIPPDLYPHWKNNFIQAACEFSPEFSDELKKQWDNGIAFCNQQLVMSSMAMNGDILIHRVDSRRC